MALEKLTVNRIGDEKVMSGVAKATGKPYNFRKVGIQVNEYPERWFDFTYNERNPLSVGQQYEFEVSSREYNGQTYWSAGFPKRGPGGGGGMSPEQYEKIMQMLNAINANVLRLLPSGNVSMAGVTNRAVQHAVPPAVGFDPAAIDAAFDAAYAANHPETDEEPSLASFDDLSKQ